MGIAYSTEPRLSFSAVSSLQTGDESEHQLAPTQLRVGVNSVGCLELQLQLVCNLHIAACIDRQGRESLTPLIPRASKIVVKAADDD